MTPDEDPYRWHPNLRGKILDPEKSLFREFSLTILRQMMEENGLPVDWWFSDEEREARRDAFLKDRMGQDLWVFAYGSLMWDPALNFAEIRRAHAPRHARRFILRDSLGGRGTPEQPGLHAALDDGDGCDGLVFRLRAETLEDETRRLWQREVVSPGYLPVIIETETAAGPVEALTFVADHTCDSIVSDITYETQVQWIAKASGAMGSTLDYVQRVAAKLRELGIQDDAVERLLKDAEALAAA